jgi:hypothetical protein
MCNQYHYDKKAIFINPIDYTVVANSISLVASEVACERLDVRMMMWFVF